MEKSEEILEKRKEKIKEKIKKHFKSPYDFGALLIIIFSAIFRYYYLFKTKGQALWLDEGSYLVMARNWALGTPAYPEPVRDYLVSIIWVPFIKLGIGELGLRFITVSVGIISFYFLYKIVAYFFGKKIGFFSLIFTAVFYEHIFWSLRFDVGTYSIFFMLTSLFFFIKGIQIKEKEKKKLIFFLSAIILAIFSLLSHAAGIFIILFYIIFVLIYSKFKFYKSKNFWICLLFFFLILSPFLIKNFANTGQIYPRYQEGWLERDVDGFSFDSFKNSLVYINTLSKTINTIAFYLFLIGLIVSLDIFLILDKIFKEKISKRNLGKIFFLLFGLISLALGMQSLFFNKGGAFFEPRYIIPYYFACLIFAAVGLDFIAKKIKKYSKPLLILFIIILLSFASYTELTKTAELITAKSQSYQGIKQGGLWLKENSLPEEKVITFETPQIIYYSGLVGIAIPNTNEEIKNKILEEKARYLLVWIGISLERAKEIVSFAEENSESITFMAAFPQGNQPTTIIYRIEDSFFKENRLD